MIDMTSVPLYDANGKYITHDDIVEDEYGETYRVAVVNGTAYLDTDDFDAPLIEIEDSRKLEIVGHVEDD